MNTQVQEAFDNAEKLYSQYAKLAELGDLAFLAASATAKQEIVASVSPVMCESYQNALLG